MSMAEPAFRRSDVQPFHQRRQDFAHTLRGPFEAIQGRGTTGGAGGPTGLATKGLDALGLAMRAVTDQGVKLRIGDAVVRTSVVRTGEAVGGDASWGATAARELVPGERPRRRGRSGWGKVPASPAGWAIIRRARFEQALEGGDLSSTAAHVRLTLTLPQRNQPAETEEQRDDQPAGVSGHRASLLQFLQDVTLI